MNKFKNFLIVVLVGLSISTTTSHFILTNQVNAMKEDMNELYIENQLLTYERNCVELAYYDYAGSIYDIEPELLESIERFETGHYTSDIYKTLNNSWGAFDGIQYKSFDSHRQSTIELARTLRLNYFNEGLDTIEEIAAKYCPGDKDNWSESVRIIYEGLKKEV